MTAHDAEPTVPGELKERGQLVASLGSSLRSGATSLGTVPKLLEELLTTGGWMDFVTRLGDHITYEPGEFADFVETLPLQGLGADLAVIERLIGPRPDLLAILYELTPARGPGRPKTLNDVQSSFGSSAVAEQAPAVPAPRKKAPAGNTVENIMRKLARDRPDLLEEVTAGRMKAYTAAVEAGWRRPQTTIPLTDPESIARKLLDKLGAEQAREVCTTLSQLVTDTTSEA
ncbi:hypothetical protein DY245_14995 [Streptomyces inhibens]|uniref:Uncharacterized protein n=1 Tax=Streptomyces inhibens TaxID=2293571 RepID=A0A371Q496_STRIH|nr:hypothetical protein [Streptomyces inhibens]REK89556.1 hypothetical protein DY245_14995 [Streptomyces inhibens]